MKKHLATILRILIAIVGLTYIAYVIQWSDSVTLSPGYQLAPTIALTETQTCSIIQHQQGGNESDSLLIEYIDHSGQSQVLTLPADKLINNDIPHAHFNYGILSTIQNANHSLLVLGLLIVAPIFPIQMTRWFILMRTRGLNVTWWQGFRLYMVGNFFNYAMPGATGGDVIKAYYAARYSHRRVDSVMSIVFDRIVGMLGLVLFAGVAGLFMLSNPLARTITTWIWSAAAVGVVISTIYFTDDLRRVLGLQWIINHLPGQKLFTSIDAAAVAYRNHIPTVIAAIALSIPIHFCLALATAIAGFALGADTSLGFLLSTLPVVFTAGALPIAPQGVGVMEFAGTTLLADPPMITANHIVGMLIFFRLYQMTYSMLGSIFLIKGDIHLRPENDDEPGATF